MYLCLSCGKEFEELPYPPRCPYCGGKLIFKKRTKLAKNIKAR